MPPKRCDTCGGLREVRVEEREAEFMGRKYTVSAHKAPCPACSVVEVRAIRTKLPQPASEPRLSAKYMEEWEAQVKQEGRHSIEMKTLHVVFREDQPVVKLVDGPTGYESVYASPSIVRRLLDGWMACLGTPGKWDRMFIPAKEMKRALKQLGLA